MKVKMKILLALVVCFSMMSPLVSQTKKTPPKKTTTTTKKAAVKKTTAKKVVAKKPVAKKPVVKPQPKSNERLVEITTDLGTMTVKLYDSTPLHRDNFIKLVETGFYDSLLFHRIIAGFMIQGGDPNSKNAVDGEQLGMGSAPGERIPAEFRPYLYHKKGALAAARDNNPERASSNCQFYIAQGQPIADAQLTGVQMNIRNLDPGFAYTAAQKQVYKTLGGIPQLDQNYTVFGEVIKGINVVDKIAMAPKDLADRPLQNIRMKMRMLN